MTLLIDEMKMMMDMMMMIVIMVIDELMGA